MRVWLPLFAALATITACSTSPEFRYYTLSAARAPSSNAAATTRSRGGPYAIDAVIIPDLLDRPQIVLRSGANSVDVLDYDRWAAPLTDQLQRVLAADLAARVGADVIIDPGLPITSRAKRRIIVSILDFDPGKGRESTLEASWIISDAKSVPTLANGRIYRARHIASAKGPDLKDVVGTMSELVTAIADDIAATIIASE